VRRLYVFLHGLTVMFERTDGKLEIVMPRVPGHVYRAGSWLAETPVESGNTLELMGVNAGTTNIHTTGFLPTIPRPYTVTRRRRAATVIVPKPAEILGLLRTQYADYAVQLRTTPPTKFPVVAEVSILVYDYIDPNQILLDGHYWQPCLTPESISLHLISTSEVPESAQHVADTEDALREVFRNYPGIDYRRSNRPPWMDAKHPRFGATPSLSERGGYMVDANREVAFALAELEDLAARNSRLERLGRMHRERRRIGCLWRRPDPLCAQDTACETFTGFES
jgi:hypothetical protein